MAQAKRKRKAALKAPRRPTTPPVRRRPSSPRPPRQPDPSPATPRDMYGFGGGIGGALIPAMPLAFGLQPGRPVGDSANDWSFAGDVLNRSAIRGGMTRSLSDILQVMAEADPQLSLAVWQWMRLTNNGHTVSAVVRQPMQQPDGTVALIEAVDPESQVIIDELAKRVGTEYGGGMDQLVGVFVRTLLKEGAVAGEIEVTADLKDIYDFHPIHPARLIFRRIRDEQGVIRRVLGVANSTGGFTPLSPDQVRFFPLDPEIANPYGHAPFAASVSAIYFKGQMLRDLRKVMHVAGNPRIDVSVLYQAALKNVPAAYQQPGNEAKMYAWVNEQVESIRRDYEKLDPDDGFVHWDHIKVDYVGPGAGGTINVEQVEKVLNRQISAGVKTLPLLLGMNETSTETHGSIQWQVYVEGVKSVQGIVRRLFEWFYGQALTFYGSTASAKMTFNQHRVIDAMVEATTKQIMANFHLIAVSQNWEDNNEAAQELFGHPAVGPDPLVLQLQQQVDQLTQLLTNQANQPSPAPAGGAAPPPAASVAKSKVLDMKITPELAESMRTLVRDYERTGDRKKLLADLVRLYTTPAEKRADEGKIDAETLAKAMGKYEKGGKDAFYDLYPDVKEALKESGHLKEGT